MSTATFERITTTTPSPLPKVAQAHFPLTVVQPQTRLERLYSEDAEVLGALKNLLIKGCVAAAEHRDMRVTEPIPQVVNNPDRWEMASRFCAALMRYTQKQAGCMSLEMLAMQTEVRNSFILSAKNANAQTIFVAESDDEARDAHTIGHLTSELADIAIIGVHDTVTRLHHIPQEAIAQIELVSHT